MSLLSQAGAVDRAEGIFSPSVEPSVGSLRRRAPDHRSACVCRGDSDSGRSAETDRRLPGCQCLVVVGRSLSTLQHAAAPQVATLRFSRQLLPSSSFTARSLYPTTRETTRQLAEEPATIRVALPSVQIKTCMGALKMRDWKMRDWNFREQETCGAPRVA